MGSPLSSTVRPTTNVDIPDVTAERKKLLGRAVAAAVDRDGGARHGVSRRDGVAVVRTFLLTPFDRGYMTDVADLQSAYGPPPSDWGRHLQQLAFAVIFLAVVVAYAGGGPPWLNSIPINLLYVGFGGIVYAQAAARGDSVRFLPALGLTLVLGLLFARLLWGGGGYQRFALVVSFFLFVAYPFAHPDGLDRLSAMPVYVLAVVMLLGAHFYHSATVGAQYPFYMGFILVMNVLFVPRYVSRRALLTATSLVGALVAALGIVAYVVGEYTLLSFSVTLYGGVIDLPFLRVTALLESIFTNPNGTGILLFVGLFAAVVELRERLDAAGRWTTAAVGGVALLNGLGLVLTHSRASWAAAAIAIGVYLSYVAFGREALPYAVGSGLALVVVGLGLVATSLVDVDPSGRFALWSAGVQAFVATLSPFGAGLVSSADLMAPYVAEPYVGTSAHNSYLTIALRTGVVGILGYLVLTVGSFVDAIFVRRRGDPAMIALVVAFAIHQLFEAYTLVQYSLGAVLAALSVGYLVTSICESHRLHEA
jgi:hypothetical protein